MRSTDIAIVGGGAGGATCAYNIKHKGNESFLIFEPSRHLGRGLAYGKAARCNLLNVPANGMSPLEADPDLFARSCVQEATHPFPSRKSFGEFMKKWTAGLTPHHEQKQIVAIRRLPSGNFILEAADGERYTVKKVVLALGQPPSKTFPFANDPWEESNYDLEEKFRQVVIIGAGLTALDVSVELLRSSSKARIIIVSRHALLPLPHAPLSAAQPVPDLNTLRETWRWLNKSRADGLWRERIDALRPRLADLWRKLPVAEQKLFFKRFRTFWEVHRHRAPPHLLQVLASAKTQGKVQLVAAEVTAVVASADGFEVTLKADGRKTTLRADKVINCSGPSALTSYRPPVIEVLISEGLATLDPHGIGLNVTAEGRLVGNDGHIVDNLFCLGAYRRGCDFESTALREIRVQASRIADLL